ncbi:glycosyl hydrolase family 17 [Capronia coronata CBS 617.96]|uniref:Probable glucan endo-1,3-beta-glucosidase eglC n=1 Tax=Capronia coronata CBS 617.96 TaxID=1182541 RepID=W9YNM8_9EURO|nr:glycosyl hydrolase family 17 [Capronia coronata CBS 617.96]EXJ94168.1 glycosyl hydrolase family 17 [Capronia coronata CBS 617.96]
MKTIQLLSLAAAAVSSADAFFKGFNIGANIASGACRSESDWEFAFNKIAGFPGSFKNVRLYASSDCNTLANAVPAALRTGTTLLVGVWTEDDAHFAAEKQALLEAIQQYGHDWILAVSVGSEDLYRGDTDANTLAGKINDVRGMLWGLGASSKSVGHVDTWTAWVDGANTPVIEAVDWLGNDAYPYWQGVGIDNGAASDAYWAAVNNVRAVAQGKDVWTTETGQPISGDSVGPAVPSVDSLQTYWWQVSCASFNSLNYFFYDLDDFAAEPGFAVVDTNYNPLIDMSCA